MVISQVLSDTASVFVEHCIPLLAEVTQDATPLIRRLSPLNQLRVIMGLFVIVILGIFLYIVIKAGSHMVRGMSAAANRLPASSLPSEDDWTKKPLNEAWTEGQSALAQDTSPSDDNTNGPEVID